MAERQLTRDDNQKHLAKLRSDCGDVWRRQLGQSRVSTLIMSGEIDKEFCAMYLVETYHYTRHNSRNQALVGVRANGISDRYRSFCFSHAAEETGHENMALRVATVGSDKKDGFHFFVMANRLFRLGELSKALRFYEQAIALGLDLSMQSLCRAAQLKAHRLLSAGLAFDELLRTIKSDDPTDPSLLRDALWEEILSKYQKAGDIKVIIAAVRKDERFQSPHFSAEAILWTLAHNSMEGIELAPSGEYVKRSVGSRTKSQRLLVDVCALLQQLYNKDIEVESRIEQLGEALHLIPKLTLLNHELLAWLAAARGLFRLRLNDNALAAVCLSQYEALSRRMTKGKTDDVLRGGRDLLDGVWYSAGM